MSQTAGIDKATHGTTGSALSSLAVSFLGLVAVLGIATATVLIEYNSGFTLFFLHALKVLPTGALITGVLIGLAYRLLSWTFEQRPWGGWLPNLAIASIAFFAFVMMSYYQLLGFVELSDPLPEGFPDIGGQAASFPAFVHLVITTTVWEFPPASASGEFGMWGYPLWVYEALAVGLGAFFTYGSRSKVHYCKACDRYMARIEHITGYCSDNEAAAPVLADLQDILARRQLAEAIVKAEGLAWPDLPPPGRSTGFQLKYFKCGGCEKAAVHYTPLHRNVDGMGFEMREPKPRNLDQYWS